MAYLLDADVLISAKNAHYRFAIVPAFWDWLAQGHANGLLLSIDRVRQELLDPDIDAWAQSCPAGFFVMPDQATLNALATVSGWANTAPNYTPAAVAAFLSKADSLLVAAALAHHHTVVTHERPSPNSQKSIKIPDACDAMQVDWCNPYDMLENEQPVFILGP